MSNRRLDGQQEAHQLTYALFVRGISLGQFRRMEDRERELCADIHAELDAPGAAKAFRYLGVSRRCPDLIAHANALETSLLKSVTSA